MSPMDRRNQIAPPPFSNRYVIEQAERLGEEAIGTLALPPLGLPPAIWHMSFDAAYNDIIYPTYGISLVEDMDLGYDDQGTKVFGKCDPIENAAFIDVSLKNDPRRAFTCWHEVGGHGVLQGNWLRQEFARIRRRGCLVTTEASMSFSATNIMERQANLFAAHAAAPTRFLVYVLVDLLNLTRPIRYIGPARYDLDLNGARTFIAVESFSDLCLKLAKLIQWRFGGLSVEALSYRIKSMPYIVQDVTAQAWTLHRTDPPPRSRPQSAGRSLAWQLRRQSNRQSALRHSAPQANPSRATSAEGVKSRSA
jgi:hypothetical protein